MEALGRVADRPTWLLSQANTRAHALLTEAFAAAGMRGYHYRVLAALEEHGSTSQAELGRATGIDRSDVVATLDDLAAWDLARRDPDPDDRRRNVVSATPTGLARLTELDRVVDDVQEALLAPLSARERAILLRLLRKLVS